MNKFRMLGDVIGDIRLRDIGYGDERTWDNPICGTYIRMQLQNDIDAGNYVDYSIVRLDDVIDGAEFNFEMTVGRRLTDTEREAWYDWALMCPIKVFKLERT